jgi:hypothetical protein
LIGVFIAEGTLAQVESRLSYLPACGGE